MRRGQSTALVLGLIFLLSIPAQAQTTQPTYPNSVDGLTQLMKDLLAASERKDQATIIGLARSMVLPEHRTWFTRTFGEAVAPRLIKEFEETTARVDVELALKFYHLREPSKLTVDVKKFEAADDLNARFFQRLALGAMQQPTPLYGVTITLPGTTAKIEIWSLVYADGAFRVAGKMQAIRP